MTTATIHRDSDGTLPAFAWPGGYPIFYLMADGECLCSKCANKEGATVDHEDKEWRIAAQDIHWEGDPIQCAHCNRDIESAYGPIDSAD